MALKRFKGVAKSSKAKVSMSKKKDKIKENAVSQEVNMGCDRLDPLSMTHILNQTIQYCTVDQLRSLRLVSRQWNTSATKFLRQKLSPINFTDEFYDLEKMAKINSVFKSSELSPCVKFGITSGFLSNDNEKVLRDFFCTCGSFMENLTICVDRSNERKFDISEDFCTEINLPKLKFLVLEDHTSQRAYNNASHPPSNQDFTPLFKALISAAVNLERLNLHFPKRLYDADYEDLGMGPTIPQLPEGLICFRPSQNLRHLDISAKLTDVQLLCLSEAGLRLRTLQFRLRNVTLDETSFTTLLQSQSETLVELRLIEERHGSDFIVKFPKMDRLSVISVSSICEFEECSVTFGTFGYQERLPKVKTLDLWSCFGREERWSPFLLAESPSFSIERLELPAQFRNNSLAQKISLVFPYLKKLKIGFALRPENAAVLRTIFCSLRNLEELQIMTDMDHQNENIDHVLTGIDKQLCKKMRENEAYLKSETLEPFERGPSVTDLKNLRKLEIIMDNSRAPFITDVSGYLGFLEMPKLKVLRFTKCGMSTECVAALNKRFNVELLPLRCGTFFEFEYIDFNFD